MGGCCDSSEAPCGRTAARQAVGDHGGESPKALPAHPPLLHVACILCRTLLFHGGVKTLLHYESLPLDLLPSFVQKSSSSSYVPRILWHPTSPIHSLCPRNSPSCLPLGCCLHCTSYLSFPLLPLTPRPTWLSFAAMRCLPA